MMNAREFLEKYAQFCDEIHAMTQEENERLRASRPLDEAFLGAKRELRERLAFALEQLRTVQPADAADRPAVRDLKARVQQKLLKVLLLNRETEQLLLKSSAGVSTRSTVPVQNMGRVRNAYLQHAA